MMLSCYIRKRAMLTKSHKQLIFQSLILRGFSCSGPANKRYHQSSQHLMAPHSCHFRSVNIITIIQGEIYSFVVATTKPEPRCACWYIRREYNLVTIGLRSRLKYSYAPAQLSLALREYRNAQYSGVFFYTRVICIACVGL